MKAEELLEHDGAWRTISLWDGGFGGCSFGAHSQPVAMESGSSVRGQQAVLGVGGGSGFLAGTWSWVAKKRHKMPRGHDMLYCGCTGVWRCSFAFSRAL